MFLCTLFGLTTLEWPIVSHTLINSSSVAPGPLASASPEDLLEIQILGSSTRFTKSDREEPAICVLISLSCYSHACKNLRSASIGHK